MSSSILPALPPACRLRLDRLADRHERDLLELALIASPGDFQILVRLGELYPRLGLLDESLRIDRKLVVMAPDDPVVRYNLACSLALTGDLPAAFTALREAIRRGYSDLAHLLQDPDLAIVRQSTRFVEILRLLNQSKRQRPA
jgi:Flp pilus assembly protein TadD